MEVVLRAAAVYAILWTLLRAMGKRELSEITAFELVILVVLGDIIQQGVTQEDMSVTGAALAASTMVLLAVGSSSLSRRFPRHQRILEGRPSVVVRDGEVLLDVLRLQRMTVEEVHEAARKRGFDTLAPLAGSSSRPMASSRSSNARSTSRPAHPTARGNNATRGPLEAGSPSAAAPAARVLR